MSNTNWYKGVTYTYEPCVHKPLVLAEGIEIHGGSCLSPVVKDADIYVGLDRGMNLTPKSLPWNKGTEFLFPIADMTAPKDPAEFHRLIRYLKRVLANGKKVHVGCIGGHGRTGTVFAALAAFYGTSPDPIAYVRDTYCKKAVETHTQIDFLVKHYDALPAKPSKVGFTSFGKKSKKGKKSKGTSSSPKYRLDTGDALFREGNIWGIVQKSHGGEE